jgi:hypothetical protein
MDQHQVNDETVGVTGLEPVTSASQTLHSTN